MHDTCLEYSTVRYIPFRALTGLTRCMGILHRCVYVCLQFVLYFIWIADNIHLNVILIKIISSLVVMKKYVIEYLATHSIPAISLPSYLNNLWFLPPPPLPQQKKKERRNIRKQKNEFSVCKRQITLNSKSILN